MKQFRLMIEHPHMILCPYNSSSSSAFPAMSLGFTTLGEMFAYVTIFFIFYSNHRGSHIPSSWIHIAVYYVFISVCSSWQLKFAIYETNERHELSFIEGTSEHAQ